MRSRRTARFKRLFEELPAEVQQSAQRAYVLFQRDPAHPRLQFKRLRADRQTYSIRIGPGYRALGLRLGRHMRRFRRESRRSGCPPP